MHACRVLPGFVSDAKCKILCTLKDQSEIIFVISGADLERNGPRELEYPPERDERTGGT